MYRASKMRTGLSRLDEVCPRHFMVRLIARIRSLIVLCSLAGFACSASASQATAASSVIRVKSGALRGSDSAKAFAASLVFRMLLRPPAICVGVLRKSPLPGLECGTQHITATLAFRRVTAAPVKTAFI